MVWSDEMSANPHNLTNLVAGQNEANGPRIALNLGNMGINHHSAAIRFNHDPMLCSQHSDPILSGRPLYSRNSD
jgi:hypothetical protein